MTQLKTDQYQLVDEKSSKYHLCFAFCKATVSLFNAINKSKNLNIVLGKLKLVSQFWSMKHLEI